MASITTMSPTAATGRVLFLAILALVLSLSNAKCPTVGGKLVGLDHGVAGNLKIGSTCTLTVTGFKYDGQAPAVYWWAAPTCNYVDIVKNGYRIADYHVTMAYTGSTFTTKLKSGVNLSKAGCIILYCEDFKADLGNVAIKKSGRRLK